MYCRKCGTSLKEEDEFCFNCGKKIEHTIIENIGHKKDKEQEIDFVAESKNIINKQADNKGNSIIDEQEVSKEQNMFIKWITNMIYLFVVVFVIVFVAAITSKIYMTKNKMQQELNNAEEHVDYNADSDYAVESNTIYDDSNFQKSSANDEIYSEQDLMKKLGVPDWYEEGKLVVKGNEICTAKVGFLYMEKGECPDYITHKVYNADGVISSSTDYIIFNDETNVQYYTDDLNSFSRSEGRNGLGMHKGEQTYACEKNILIGTFLETWLSKERTMKEEILYMESIGCDVKYVN